MVVSIRELNVCLSAVDNVSQAIINTMGHELGVNAIRTLGYCLHKVLCAVYSEVGFILLWQKTLPKSSFPLGAACWVIDLSYLFGLGPS